ncbi:carboxypeptidase-like regulatory domain-containing protein [Mucilaginibacter conchicola]|uniref:Carboxypeptidase-like regulatory domain-containing protein n=1 Tax=Mucilaginibacter conchicola TaxID=2303333 RepID=A0A372NXI4_9SPHI|nr:carboxypeptidase-like regulatory domain-containing protein [Mucilaginibacter conchicola]
MIFSDTYKHLLLILFLFTSICASAQNTVVTGTVTDATNKQPLPFVSIAFTRTTVGTNTDNNGKYALSTSQAVTELKISYLGYKETYIKVQQGKEQVINVKLMPTSQSLSEVTVQTKKRPKYDNENPAVKLIRQVIANKPKNRPEAYNYVEYKEYDKMQFSLSNISEKTKNRKIFRKYKFIFENKDSTTYAGKTLLPIYMKERLTQVFYRKNPEVTRNRILGEKSVDFGPGFDTEGIGQYFQHLYAKVDIYDNDVLLLGRQFLSPISDNAPTFYKYFITDTITLETGKKLVQLSFTPRNTNNILFEGDIFITLDGNYAVQKAALIVNGNINVNFVRSMNIDQDFELSPDGRYHMSRSNTFADFGITAKRKSGLFGSRTIVRRDFTINKPRPDTTYQTPPEVEDEELRNRPDSFWVQARYDTLTTAESKVYKNIDSLVHMPSFKRTANLINLLFAGFKNFGKFEIGPASTFYSFNPVEGLRLRVGGRTTADFSKKIFFEGYTAYGFKDEKWKYFFATTYSLNGKSIYRFPQHYIRASFQRDTKIPGQELQFISEDNVLLSFKRGRNDKYYYNDQYRLEYVSEYANHFSYKIGLRNLIQTPAGSLVPFINTAGTQTFDKLTTSEATIGFRYAPNEQYYQGKLFRTPIINQYPKLSLEYTAGLKVLDGQYQYHKIDFRGEKRFYLAPFGFSDVILEGSRTFGQVPYPLLNISRGNQTFAYVIDQYNLMNFLEFVSDKSASIIIDHHFGGFFFNKIPLFKKLKWRETASFKSLWGGLSAENTPALHPNLYRFPADENGVPITYALQGNRPYTEVSVGVENIFKFVRLDYVRRLTYLENPDVAKWGIRVKIKFDF